jgi:prepilin-type N-terminal cleavage/methylation domain-containing protein
MGLSDDRAAFRTGFTLIEIVCALALVLLVGNVTFGLYGVYRSQIFTAEYSFLLMLLHEARGRAVFSGNGAYLVSVSPDVFTLEHISNTGIRSQITSYKRVGSISVPEGMSVLFQQEIGHSSTAHAITVAYGGRTRVISVSEEGMIE